ncbi:MAG TPA: GNAT family N-acetyltransferase [Vicinamibacteria bacterium]|nr:GNAT family N-acetyltransferase [Vicinamibacteria bacterium]
MSARFALESEYAGVIRVDPERVAETIANVATSDNGAIFVAGDEGDPRGMIVLVAYDHPYSGERTAYELAWWMEPEARSDGDGLRLLRAAEEWGREVGAKTMYMVAPNDRVGALYQRLGYAKVETSYQRSL